MTKGTNNNDGGGFPPPLKPLVISVDQFRSLLQCGRTTAFEMVRTKRVRSILIGRSRRILLVDAEQLVADALNQVQD
jgi:hypothetical protein